MPVSFFTPSSYATAPQPNLATSLIPPLAQGLFKAAQTYQAGKAMDQAAKEAATLFKDPAVGNIFRQMGASALAQGQDPTPVINSMLSTAITLKRDEENAARQERMQMRGFSNQMSLQNDQQAFQSDYMSPGSIGKRQQAEVIGDLSGKATFLDSEMGQGYAQAQAVEEDRKREARVEESYRTARETTRARIQVQREQGVLPNQGSEGSDALFDSGIDLDTPITDFDYTGLDDLENELLTYGESSPQAKSQIQNRLRAVQDQKRTLLDRDKTRAQDKAKGKTSGSSSKDSSVPTRYFTP